MESRSYRNPRSSFDSERVIDSWERERSKTPNLEKYPARRKSLEESLQDQERRRYSPQLRPPEQMESLLGSGHHHLSLRHGSPERAEITNPGPRSGTRGQESISRPTSIHPMDVSVSPPTNKHSMQLFSNVERFWTPWIPAHFRHNSPANHHTRSSMNTHTTRRGSSHASGASRSHTPDHHSRRQSGRWRRSSRETSPSSFDFIPPNRSIDMVHESPSKPNLDLEPEETWSSDNDDDAWHEGILDLAEEAIAAQSVQDDDLTPWVYIGTDEMFGPAIPKELIGSDLPVLDPKVWVSSIINIEKFVLERSYLWYAYIGEPIAAHGISESLCGPGQILPGTFYHLLSLPDFTKGAPSNVLSCLQTTEGKVEKLTIETRVRWKVDQLRLSRNILLTLLETMNLLATRFSFDSPITLLVGGELPHVVELQSFDKDSLVQLLVILDMTILETINGRLSSTYTASSSFKGSGYIPSSDGVFDFLRCTERNTVYETQRELCHEVDWLMLTVSLDVALVSHCGAHIVSCDNHLSALSFMGTVGREGSDLRLDPELRSRFFEQRYFSFFRASKMACLDSLIDAAEVWVLQPENTELKDRQGTGVQGLSLLTTANTLSDVWGPVYWVNTESRIPETRASSTITLGKLHVLSVGSGMVCKAASSKSRKETKSHPSATLCHFTLNAEYAVSQPLTVTSNDLLLIGASSLEDRDCRGSSWIPPATSGLIPAGTSRDIREKASSTYVFGFHPPWVQTGYQRQYVLRLGTTRKQRLLKEWKAHPELQDPRKLFLRCGLEASLCTHNARRVPLIEILKSQVLKDLRDRLIFNDERCGEAFRAAMDYRDHDKLISLWEEHREWREEIGRGICIILEVLSETGMSTTRNDLLLLTTIDGADDPEHLFSFAEKDHSWVPLTKDTLETATFAITTDKCLAFPHPRLPGQRCRFSSTVGKKYSVLQTRVGPLPIPGHDLPDRTWTRDIPEGKHLCLDESQTHMLKLVRRIRDDELVVRWSDKQFARGARLLVPATSGKVFRFREVIDAGRDESLLAARVFVISKHEVELPVPAPPPQGVPAIQAGQAQEQQVSVPRPRRVRMELSHRVPAHLAPVMQQERV